MGTRIFQTVESGITLSLGNAGQFKRVPLRITFKDSMEFYKYEKHSRRTGYIDLFQVGNSFYTLKDACYVLCTHEKKVKASFKQAIKPYE